MEQSLEALSDLQKHRVIKGVNRIMALTVPQKTTILTLDSLAPRRLIKRITDSTQTHLLEEKKSRKGKNTHNTTKSNTTPIKPKDPTTERLEQSNIDEAE